MRRLPIVILVVLLLTACAPAAQGFVDLPPALESSVAIVVATLLTLGLDFLIGFAPFLAFLRAYQEGFAISISGLFIAAIENALPTGSESLSIAGVEFALAIALYLLVRLALMRRRVRGFVKEY